MDSLEGTGCVACLLRVCQPSWYDDCLLRDCASSSRDTGPNCLAGLPAEANLLAAQAVSAGVPLTSVVIEDKAQNSIENALNCLPILQSKGVHDVVLVTSDYHMPRCRLLFELVLQGTSIELSWAEVRAVLASPCCKPFPPSSLSCTLTLLT